MRVIVRDGPVLAQWGEWQRAYSSAVGSVEVRRTLNRLRLKRVYSEEEFVRACTVFEATAQGIDWLPVTDTVLRLAAERSEKHLKTLDSLHLATARMVRDLVDSSVYFAAHDHQMALAAAELDFEVKGDMRAS